VSSPWFGAVADDVTGAVDLAGEMAAAGSRAVVVFGVPDASTELPDVDAVVVALKSRTAPASRAVSESLASARWLLDHGVRTLYQKYCSTFDSTDEGNIGPVAEALLGLRPAGSASVGTPATPHSRRTQYQGTLFVGDRLLSESSLATHPLTPMTDPDLVRVLGRQSTAPVGLVHHEVVRSGTAAITAETQRLVTGGARHVLVDAIDETDLDAIAAAIDPATALLGGGAGLATAIARVHGGGSPGEPPTVAPGGALIVSGSGSERTREQVAAYPGPVVTIDPLDLDGVHARVREAMKRGTVLVSATASPDEVRRVQAELGVVASAQLIESTLAELVRTAVDEWGVTGVIVAGGETSGAVVEALGVRMLHLGERVAPGVTWSVATTPGRPPIALLLKSGNFGGEDLFTTAWESAP
jgi:uncharacterized protein YgbK (DUF1537 family)